MRVNQSRKSNEQTGKKVNVIIVIVFRSRHYNSRASKCPYAVGVPRRESVNHAKAGKTNAVKKINNARGYFAARMRVPLRLNVI